MIVLIGLGGTACPLGEMMRLDETFPCYPSISERDVNLLLVEEVMTSEAFHSKLSQSAEIQRNLNPREAYGEH